MVINVRELPAEGVSKSGKPSENSVDEGIGGWVLAATISGSSITLIDGTVVNIAERIRRLVGG